MDFHYPHLTKEKVQGEGGRLSDLPQGHKQEVDPSPNYRAGNSVTRMLSYPAGLVASEHDPRGTVRAALGVGGEAESRGAGTGRGRGGSFPGQKGLVEGIHGGGGSLTGPAIGIPSSFSEFSEHFASLSPGFCHVPTIAVHILPHLVYF